MKPPGDSLLVALGKPVRRGREGASLSMIFLAGEYMQSSIRLGKKITAIHKEQISQANDFRAFLGMGRCRNLGSLKFFLRYASNSL